MSVQLHEVHRILNRYLVEVVEAFELCPWARPARLGDEVAVGVAWGSPDEQAFVTIATELLARPRTRVAMVVAPELAIAPLAWRVIRDRVALAIPAAGVADFHPHATLDVATPARAVPFARRSPDPLLQLVPLALLDAVRGPPPIADRARQVAILRGAPADVPIADRIAATNHATIAARHADIEAVLSDIAADRARSYARLEVL